MGVHPEDRPKTAFTTPLGLFEFQRMPFGLCNGPATFQRLMQHCLSDYIVDFLLVYLDDVIVYSADFATHLRHLEQVFQRLSQYGLKLRLDKCQFFQRQVKFLGHVVDKTGISPDPGKTAAVQEWPVPSTVREVRAFLGLAGYYRRFIANFARIAQPLNALLVGVPADKKSSNRKIQWTTDCQAAFVKLKTCLTQAPILAYADFSLPFVLYTDASHKGLGAVLSQVQDGQERVIAYASRSLHPAERNDANYSSFKLELLALKWAITEKFKDFLTGAKCTVVTDNNPVAHLQTARLGAVEQRWVAQLANFDFTVKYWAGCDNTNADSLSRFPVAQTAPIEVRQVEAMDACQMVTDTLDVEEWRKSQSEDEELQQVWKYVESSSVPTVEERTTMSMTVKRLLQQKAKLVIQNGVLYKRMIDPSTHELHLQIICPASRREEVWKRYHDASAHAGVARTLSRVRHNFYWPKMEETMKGFHLGCVICGLQKGRDDKAPLHPIEVSFPLEVIALDFLTLGRPADSCQNILVVVDMFTRYAWAIPTSDQTAKVTVRALWEHVVQTFGCPLRFHSDMGPNFESALMKEFCQLYGTAKSRTTPYHPAGNGRVERVNKTLLGMLRTLERDKQDRWPEFLPELMQAYNNTTHGATGFIPSYLMFGRSLRTPVDVSLGVGAGQNRMDLKGWVQEHHQKLSWAYALAKKTMDEAAKLSKQTYDSRVKAIPFLVGQRVWICDRNRQGRGKLCSWWDPMPYVVLGTLGSTGLVYRVRPEHGGQEKVLHRNALKLCSSPEVGQPQPIITEGTSTHTDPLPYSMWVALGPDYGNGENQVRRSTRPNLGQWPVRYR